MKDVLDHTLQSQMTLKPAFNCERSWIYRYQTESDGEITYAIRFKTGETAQQFKNEFEKAVSGLKSDDDTQQEAEEKPQEVEAAPVVAVETEQAEQTTEKPAEENTEEQQDDKMEDDAPQQQEEEKKEEAAPAVEEAEPVQEEQKESSPAPEQEQEAAPVQEEEKKEEAAPAVVLQRQGQLPLSFLLPVVEGHHPPFYRLVVPLYFLQQASLLSVQLVLFQQQQLERLRLPEVFPQLLAECRHQILDRKQPFQIRF